MNENENYTPRIPSPYCTETHNFACKSVAADLSFVTAGQVDLIVKMYDHDCAVAVGRARPDAKYWQRAWTKAELAREHPLPKGWGWLADSGDCWSAVCQGGAVGVDEFGHVFLTSDGMPSEVVLAVIQASKAPPCS